MSPKREDIDAYGDVLDRLSTYADVQVRPGYRIAIPSYDRADLLPVRTLATLQRLHVDADRVTIFVANDEQAELYGDVLHDEWHIVTAVPRLASCRAWYSHAYYHRNERILSLDDDIDDVLQLNPDTGKLDPYDGDIDTLAVLGWAMCDAIGARLWGISAVENGFYMSDEAVAGLRYICGIWHGHRAGDSTNEPPKPVSSGADFVRSIEHFRRYGNVVQLRWLCPKTTYFGKGGMQSELGGKDERARDHGAALRDIARTYPRDAKLVTKSKGTNLRLRAVTNLRIPRESMLNQL